MLGDVDGGEQVIEPSLGAGEFLVAGRQRLAGGEHVPQVVSGPLVRMGIQCVMGGGQAARGDLGEDAGSGSVARQFRALRGWRAVVMASNTPASSAGMLPDPADSSSRVRRLIWCPTLTAGYCRPGGVACAWKGSGRWAIGSRFGSLVTMIELPVPASVERTLGECLRRGLEVRSERELGGRPGSHHYHLAFPGKPGTLELSEWQGEVWFSVNERRDCGWVSEFARTTAAAMRHAQGQ